MRYYHVLPASYHPGEDILTFDELDRMGRRPEWKWGPLESETNMVALFRHHADAFAYSCGGMARAPRAYRL